MNRNRSDRCLRRGRRDGAYHGSPVRTGLTLVELLVVIAILGVDRTIVAGNPGRRCGGAANPVRHELIIFLLRYPFILQQERRVTYMKKLHLSFLGASVLHRRCTACTGRHNFF